MVSLKIGINAQNDIKGKKKKKCADKQPNVKLASPGAETQTSNRSRGQIRD